MSTSRPTPLPQRLELTVSLNCEACATTLITSVKMQGQGAMHCPVCGKAFASQAVGPAWRTTSPDKSGQQETNRI